jgi:NAD(P)-dependent dehydrogenase (short-subunit alcohol dehydrogenase family)
VLETIAGTNGRRRAVVTGAARGIGEGIARRLAQDGMEVVGVDRDEQGLSRLAAHGITPLVADLAKPEERARVVEAADGGDYLVNAAAIIRLVPIFETTLDDWRDIYAVNAEATFFLCQQIGPRLRPNGAIVNFSSVSAKASGTTEAAIYASSKAAVISITRSFAYALASRPVRVNCICPGITDTPMQEQVLEEVSAIRGVPYAQLSEARLAQVPLARSTTPDELAGLIAFLLSDEASYMTGQALNFSGGLVMT